MIGYVDYKYRIRTLVTIPLLQEFLLKIRFECPSEQIVSTKDEQKRSSRGGVGFKRFEDDGLVKQLYDEKISGLISESAEEIKQKLTKYGFEFPNNRGEK